MANTPVLNGVVGYDEIAEDDTPLAKRKKLNFDSAHFAVSDNAGTSSTDVTLPGASNTNIRTTAVGLTLISTDHAIEYTGAGPDNFPFPAAATCPGREYIMCGTGAGDMTLVRSGSDKFGGVAADFVMNAGAGQRTRWMSNGIDNWVRVG